MRRYYFLILAALLIFFGMESEAQVDGRFAMAASFSNITVVDDSTYTADLAFQSDQLGQGYLANQVQVGWRVITSTRREYRISAVNSSSFSTANLTLVELPGTNASPNGVATVYEYDGSTRIIPTLPVNSTGISSAKLATLLIHNFEQIAAGGGGGTLTSLPADSVTVADPNTVFTGEFVEAVLYELYLDIVALQNSIQAVEVLAEEHGFKEDTLAAIGAASGFVRKYGLDDLKNSIMTGNATSGYTITIQTAEHGAQVDFIGDSSTANASGELVLIINNGLDNYGYYYNIDMYDLANNQMVDIFTTGNVPEQVRTGTSTTITIPNISGNYPSGFRVQLR